MRQGILSLFREGLRKTRESLAGRLEGLWAGHSQVDEEFYEELEAILLQADVGVETTRELLSGLRERSRRQAWRTPEDVRLALQQQVEELLRQGGAGELARAATPPTVVLVVGVNGTGKTTSIGKLAYWLRSRGHKVMLGAADTFRAAAGEQLEVWAERAQAEIVRHQAGSDPAAVAFDAVQAARARGCDYVLVDTAGRLHTRTNLMEELKKISRVLGREVPGAPHETLLVLDATTGQNALSQAREFGAAVGISGLILTKLDGTAKGGVVLALARARQLPVKFVGLGEQLDDLQPFDPAAFADGLFAAGNGQGTRSFA